MGQAARNNIPACRIEAPSNTVLLGMFSDGMLFELRERKLLAIALSTGIKADADKAAAP